ncbi:MAG: adenylate cyclase [Porticoccaceae bacterium]|jgi:adenylate cyclase
MKLTLRRSLMLALLTLPLIVVALLGFMSYNNAVQIIESLGANVVQQTTERVRAEVGTLLNEASLLSFSNQDFVRRKQPDQLRLALDFRRQMLQHHDFSYLSYSQTDGSYMHVHRRADNIFEFLSIKDGNKQISSWSGEAWIAEGPVLKSDNDPRTRSYYKAAVAAQAQTWTDVYLFGYQPNPQYPGLTCATPVYDNDGELLGVLTVDFALSTLSSYLHNLQVFKSGEAFVLDSDQILAHPDINQVVKTEQLNGVTTANLLLSDQAPSGAIKGFLNAVKQSAHSNMAEYEWTTDNIDYLGFTEPLSNVHDFDWSVAIIVPRLELTESVESHTRMIGWIALASITTLIFVGVVLARSIAKPLRRLTEEVGQIGQFQIAANPLPDTWLWEVERLSKATEEMKTGLRSFGKFVPIELVRSVLTTGVEAKLGGEERELTIFFSDIRGFTSIAEQLSPPQLVNLLGEYFGAMTAEIIAANGTVDKYIGDAIMAFWGAPESNLEHATDACDAALRNMHRLQVLQQQWRQKGLPLIDCRIGLNTGLSVVGNIGSEDRLNYTAIGDAVNLAARLEGLNKFYGTSVLLSEFTANAAQDDFIFRPLERVAVKGKSEGILVYELLARASEADDQQKRLADLSAAAHQQFCKRNFDKAGVLFQQILELRQNDLAALRGVKSCIDYQAAPPPQDWNAIRIMDSK